MKTQTAVITLAVAVFATVAFADYNRTDGQGWTLAQNTSNPFANINAIRCDFLPGVTADWETGRPVESKSRFDPIVFHSLNFETNTAIMKGNNYSPKVRLFWTDKGMTFVEWLDGDVVVITTVWAHTVGTKPLRLSAVHSRHRMLGSPLPSQFHGVCEVL